MPCNTEGTTVSEVAAIVNSPGRVMVRVSCIVVFTILYYTNGPTARHGISYACV
jgi:hypothetical protein